MASSVQPGEIKLDRLSRELARVAGELRQLAGPASVAAEPSSGRAVAQRLRLRLAAARKARGLTQTELARALDRGQGFVTNYERGERRLEVGEFIDIARALDLEPTALLEEIGGR